MMLPTTPPTPPLQWMAMMSPTLNLPQPKQRCQLAQPYLPWKPWPNSLTSLTLPRLTQPLWLPFQFQHPIISCHCTISHKWHYKANPLLHSFLTSAYSYGCSFTSSLPTIATHWFSTSFYKNARKNASHGGTILGSTTSFPKTTRASTTTKSAKCSQWTTDYEVACIGTDV